MFFIPIGTKYTSTVTGSDIKTVECENCKQTFVYEVICTADGQQTDFLWMDKSGATDRAESAAEQSLNEQLNQAIEVVPCPTCGWIQQEMCWLIFRRRHRLIFVVGLLIAIALLVWAISIIDKPNSISTQLLTVSGIIGAISVFLGYPLARLFDPNKNHPGPDGIDQNMIDLTPGISYQNYQEMINDAAEKLSEAERSRTQTKDQELNEIVRRTLLAAVENVHEIDEEEMEKTRLLIQELSGLEYEYIEIKTDILHLKDSWKKALAQMKGRNHLFSPKKRLTIFRNGAKVAASSKTEVTDQQLDYLVALSKVLALSNDECYAVLDELGIKA